MPRFGCLRFGGAGISTCSKPSCLAVSRVRQERHRIRSPWELENAVRDRVVMTAASPDAAGIRTVLAREQLPFAPAEPRSQGGKDHGSGAGLAAGPEVVADQGGRWAGCARRRCESGVEERGAGGDAGRGRREAVAASREKCPRWTVSIKTIGSMG